MAEKTMRLSQLARTLNVGTNTIVDFLGQKGFDVDHSPNTKISPDQVTIVKKEFQDSALDKEEASEISIGAASKKNVVIDSESVSDEPSERDDDPEDVITIKNLGAADPKEEKFSADKPKLEGIKVLGKIDLDNKKKPVEEKKPEKPEPTAKKEEEVKEVKPEAKPAAKKVEPKEEKKPEPEKTPVAETKKEETPKKVEAKEEKPPVEKKEEKPPVKASKEDKPQKEEAPKPKPVASSDPKVEKEVRAEQAAEKTEASQQGNSIIEAKADSLKGLTVLGKIELPSAKKKEKKKFEKGGKGGNSDDAKKKRKRVRLEKPVNVQEESKKQKPGGNTGPGRTVQPYQHKRGGGPGNRQRPGGNNQGGKRGNEKTEISNQEIQDKIKATIQKLSGGGGGGGKGANRSKYRREKRSLAAEQREEQELRRQEDSKVIKASEFISANDLASLMDVTVNEIISACMSLGMFVSINQRLDAETISIIADEFGYKVDFSDVEEEAAELVEEDDKEEDLEHRAPIVTIMGHVDHGKTSLLDYIRDAKIAEGEAGGITQHIGAYSVKNEAGKRISFLDTPGHEAFTAMRARGAKVTDVVILVVAADDRVMPQTKEAINHAQAAGVPIIVAINKIDKPNANADKIREELSQQNILVEDWGGKYQCQEVSAKSGKGIDELLEKVLLEAELLDLKANPNRSASGVVIEASLDKGRGYLATFLIQKGTLNVGDTVVAGQYFGRVKAMLNHRGTRLEQAGPSRPVQVLGLNGAPQAGDKILVVETDKEAREITNKRAQLIREQSIRTKKHLTLDEIGRRLAVGSFKELNLIIRGDVDGSVEALTDSLLKLSTEEVQVNVIQKGVGQITESDVLLATASDAIILGFQVRPSAGAKRIAEQEEIEIRTYSIIYKAIDEMKDALEGLLEPTVEEVVTGNVEIREVFKISKVGTVAGCYVLDGHINRNNPIRLIRDGVVIYEGQIGALKRFKDDVSEVKFGYECGLSIKNFNDIQVGDVVETYEEREIKRKLK